MKLDCITYVHDLISVQILHVYFCTWSMYRQPSILQASQGRRDTRNLSQTSYQNTLLHDRDRGIALTITFLYR